MFRVQFDMTTGLRTEVAQSLYRNDSGDYLVLDSDDVAPDGYYSCTLDELPEQKE